MGTKKPASPGKLAQLIEAVGSVRGVLSAAGGIGAVSGLGFLISSSVTVLWSIIAGGALGSVVGIVWAGWAYRNSSLEFRRRRSMFFFVGSLAAFAILVALLVVLNPDLARKYALFQEIYEFLITADPLVNALSGLFAAIAAGGLAAAIVLVAPKS